MYIINPLCEGQTEISLTRENRKKYFPKLTDNTAFYMEKRGDDFYIETTLYGEALVNAIKTTEQEKTYIVKYEPKNTEQRSLEPIQLDFLNSLGEVDFKEQVITEELKRGSGFVHGKFRIYNQYFFKEKNIDFANFLKDEYGLGGWYGFGRGAEYNAKGITIQVKGQENSNDNFKLLLSWKEVAKRISSLLDRGEYLTEKEEKEYEQYQTQKIDKDITLPKNTSEEIEIKPKTENELIEEGREMARQKVLDYNRPYVIINWSEYNSLKCGDVLPFAVMNSVLKDLNDKEKANLGYYKTKFDIYFPDGKGGIDEYNAGRYDIGSENGDLLTHIREVYDYNKSKNNNWENLFLKRTIALLENDLIESATFTLEDDVEQEKRSIDDMTNKEIEKLEQLAKECRKFIPDWEWYDPDNIYDDVLEMLENKDKEGLEPVIELLESFPNAKGVIEDIQTILSNETSSNIFQKEEIDEKAKAKLIKKIENDKHKQDNFVVVDTAIGGYAETSYEYFVKIEDANLYYSEKYGVYYIGDITDFNKNNLVFKEEVAKQDFVAVKDFVEKQVSARETTLKSYDIEQLKTWQEEKGRNKYLGEHILYKYSNYLLQELKKEDEIKQQILEEKETNKSREKKRMSNNSIVVQGKVMATPEVKTSAKGIKYTRVPIMTESSYNDKTTRQNITIVFFGDIADKTAVLKEGDFAEIKGRAINEKNSENKLTLGIVGYEMSKVAEGYKNTSVLSGFINNKNLEIKQGEKGTKYITVALAVKREGEEKVYDTYFVNAFGKSAERIAQTYSQGDLIELTGSIQGDNGKLSLIAHRSKLLREVIKENQNKNQQVKTSEDINDNN